ncbi:PREDICTED: apolipoprotein L6-like [Chinchilla lanigera]|uniref:apolipoprotein L6-like n=1 Tax=Chinchilla lanigera TaxID=34839 RepID=UPI0006978C73|nr:PREDICTED: apolipoprotein L6-like [Chinchilla lanigera]
MSNSAVRSSLPDNRPSERSDSLCGQPAHMASLNMETSSAAAPLNTATRERFPVRQGFLRSSLKSQPEKHLIPGNVDMVLKRQPDNQPGEKDDTIPETDMGLYDGNLTPEEIKFLEEFPQWKKEQEHYITTLRAFAEDADKMHKKFTKSKVVSNSVTVASEVASIVGLALVPVTAGASLLLSTASKGVSAAAAVTTMVTEFREKSHNKKLRAQASSQVPMGDQEPTDTGEKQSPNLTAAGQALYRCGRALQVIKKGIRALWPVKAQPRSGTSAKHLRTADKVSASARMQVQKARPGKVLTVAKIARMSVRAFASMSLNEGVSALWKNWKQLKDESKAELAEELRAQARELEEVLEQYSECYDALLKKRAAGMEGSLEPSNLQDDGGYHRECSSPQAEDTSVVPTAKASRVPMAVPCALPPPPRLPESLINELLLRRSSLKEVKKTQTQPGFPAKSFII